MLTGVSNGLSRGLGAFLSIAPGPEAMLAPKIAKVVARSLFAFKLGRKVHENKGAEEIIGGFLGSNLMAFTGKRRVGKWFTRTLRRVGDSKYRPMRGLGAMTRHWYTENDRSTLDDRIVRDLTVVYHDANKAGKHVDVHLGHLSLVYRITGKPVEDAIKFNSKGELTNESRSAILNHIRAEIRNNSRVPWNHDHTVSNARCSWVFQDSRRAAVGYGEGPTRQVVLRDKVEFYHPRVKSSLHFYAPAINPHQGMYIHELYPGDEKRAPILVAGNLIPRDRKFEDRLHLRMIQEEDFRTKFLSKVDHSTITRKYDGASTYFSSNGQGFKFFSPRVSKVTAHRIEYTYKLPELADKGSNHHPVGMAECLFWKRTPIGWLLWLADIRGPEYIAWKYTSAAETGGILNSHAVRSRTVFPELRVYRMDRWDGGKTFSLQFMANRKLQKRLCRELDLPYWKVVSLAPPIKLRPWEGLVATPYNLSVNDAYKCKWWQDALDWEVTDVQFGISPKGAIEGVVYFRSLESGREFKLGPGAMGTAEQCMDMLQNGNRYIGRVAKVISRTGHEGRAARFTGEWHSDK